MRLYNAKAPRLAASLTMVGFVLLFSSAPAIAACKGDNGDVKVHALATAPADQRNEPKVCEFYLDAFNFDSAQNVNWRISDDTHGATALTGTLTLDRDGHGVTDRYTLPDGMYKLYWNFSGEKGSAKHKVFKVACAPVATPTVPCPKPVPTPTPTPTPTVPPVVGRGGGEVLGDSTVAAVAVSPAAATLPNTGVSTLTTTVLSLLILSLTAGIVSYRPKHSA